MWELCYGSESKYLAADMHDTMQSLFQFIDTKIVCVNLYRILKAINVSSLLVLYLYSISHQFFQFMCALSPVAS